ncbi:MAG: hypothetical protein EAS51_13270 [Microbacteriaceae bacterium]|nr:MAG: hypothetical protein EAS51_13270 [Microbacteriaceae bacterium]
MAHSSIPDLPAAGPLTGTELFHVVQGGNSRKVPGSALAQLASGLLGGRNWSVPFRGALVRRSAAFTASFPLFYAWDAIAYDTDGFFSVAQSSRFTIPPGVKKVRLAAQSVLGSNAVASGFYYSIQKNGGGFDYAPILNIRQNNSGYGDNRAFLVSPVIEVEPGDYFELRVNSGNSASATVTVPADAGAWFGIEVVEADDVVSLPYDSKVLALGAVAASSVVDLDVAPRAYRLAENAAGSQFYADTAPSASTAFDVQKNGVSIGTLTFGSGSNTGAFVGAQVDFAPGDVRKIIAPSASNGIADLAFTLRLEAL